ncbi:MAG: 16S rRNA (guanine(966)-N(2))-methyltransferase RsmD [Candidatus Kapabacteria bacterium]|nr:16S rRNA (guanine(966)-N(2))-methyltransferase RsmD [Candidatus Kapabacteria bacterium]MDW8225211.1 16S rRNA (guanine(966)-N(2))-methyltransferase RsmD [Bacteroidota bacterium]
MRITGGIWRSRQLAPAVATPVRPTMDRVRKALFDRLEHLTTVEGAVVADLFAGTGALGIEALSRGALYCTFIERNRRLCNVLRQTLCKLEAEPHRYRILVDDVFRALLHWRELMLPQPQIILADPPYHMRIGSRLLHTIAQAEWPLHGAFLCLELSRCEVISEYPEGWQFHSERLFGDTRIQWWLWHGRSNAPRTLPGHL